MPEPTRPPKPPKPAMRWGVYSNRGYLWFTEITRCDAKEKLVQLKDGFIARVMVTPIASKGTK